MPFKLRHMTSTLQRHQDAHRTFFGSEISAVPDFPIVVSVDDVSGLDRKFLRQGILQIGISLLSPGITSNSPTPLQFLLDAGQPGRL